MTTKKLLDDLEPVGELRINTKYADQYVQKKKKEELSIRTTSFTYTI